MVRLVEEWSAAHPRKTRQGMFLEQWPNAYMKYDTPVVKLCDLSQNTEMLRGIAPDMEQTVRSVATSFGGRRWSNVTVY